MAPALLLMMEQELLTTDGDANILGLQIRKQILLEWLVCCYA